MTGARYFPPAEYEERWAKVHAEMKRRGHSVALVWGKTSGVYERAGDMLYLTNFFSTHSGQEPDCELWNARGFSAVILQDGQVPDLHTDEAEPRLDIIATDRFSGHYDVIKGIADALAARKISGRVALVGSDFLPVKYARQLEQHAPKIEFVPDDDLVRNVRKIKSQRELECFREGGQIVTRGLTALMEALIQGKTEAEAAAAGAKIIMESGGSWHRIPISHGKLGRYLESDPLVGFSTAAPKQGDMFHGWIYGPIYQGYWLDPGRTAVCGGKPSPEQRAMTEKLVEIMQRLMAEIRPGVRVKHVAALGDELMEKSGYISEVLKKNWPYYGHGNGCMWERPYIEPRLCSEDEVFEENMVASVEGFFDLDGVGTAGYETNYIITKQGIEVITPVRDIWW
jgi:Xaa-Pro aminopeptidase